MNSHLDTLTKVLTCIVMAEAMAVVPVNIYSAQRGMPTGRVVRYCVATLAVVQVCAYTVLLFSNVDPGKWATFARGVGVIVWPVVWAWPACASVRQRSDIKERARTVE